MGNRLNKIYEKAMDYYHGGYIDKALEQCEKGISLDLKDARILNLKGMLLYIKGDLKGAVAVWQINNHYNNDGISKIYLKDAKEDDENVKLYSLAEKEIREFKIDDALEKLEKCRESDFNGINVNNALAICYLRKGNYLRALEFNEKSLKINKEGKTALEIKSQINGYLEDPSDEFKTSMKKKAIVILVLLISSLVVVLVVSKGRKGNEDSLANINDGLTMNEEVIISENLEEDTLLSENIEEEEIIKLQSEEEIEKAYEGAIDLFDSEKYDEAIEVLKRAYNSDLDTYYHKHILFLLASCHYEKKQFKEAIENYEEYIAKYDETYIEEIYYKLALAYEDIDLKKSKEYASHMQKEFANSIYNNSRISQIISK